MQRPPSAGPHRLAALHVATSDPLAAATFWSSALAGSIDGSGRHGPVVHAPGTLPMRFAPAGEPKRVKNRVHLDVHTRDVPGLSTLGARVVAVHDGWTVLADPDGNELCAFAPDAAAPDAPMRVSPSASTATGRRSSPPGGRSAWARRSGRDLTERRGGSTAPRAPVS